MSLLKLLVLIPLYLVSGPASTQICQPAEERKVKLKFLEFFEPCCSAGYTLFRSFSGYIEVGFQGKTMMRFFTITILIFISFLTSAIAAEGQPLRDLLAIRSFSNEIMAGIAAKEISLDAERLIPYWARLKPEHIREKVAAIREEELRRRHLFGNTLGWEFIGVQQVGESVVRLSYIEKLERAPMLWRFYFYKAEGAWSLQGVLLDDELSYIFREVAK